MPEPLIKAYPKALQLPAGSHVLCGCFKSQCWPQCDQTHRCCAEQGYKLELAKPRFVWVCQCGASSELPFCDGEAHITFEKQEQALCPKSD